MSFNRDAYLMHYNHNHDRLGRFARSVGSAGGKVGSSVMSSGKKKKKGQPPEADIKKGKAANTKLSDKDRKRIVDSGDAKEVAKYKDRLSTRELETAVNRLQKEKVQRIDLEKKLSDLNSDGRDKQRATAIDKIEKYGNDLERISNGLEKAAKMYNTAAKIHNLMSSGNDQWPIYGEKKSKDKSAKEKELIERGEKLKERNLKTKENKSKREEREEAFASRKLDDAEADYDREREKKARQERLSKIQIQTYNPDNEEGTYYSDKIYEYSADGEGKYYTVHDYEKKKKSKLRHDDFIEAGENFLAHYNHNHDKLGRFATSNGGFSETSNRQKKKRKQIDKYFNSLGFSEKYDWEKTYVEAYGKGEDPHPGNPSIKAQKTEDEYKQKHAKALGLKPTDEAYLSALKDHVYDPALKDYGPVKEPFKRSTSFNVYDPISENTKAGKPIKTPEFEKAASQGMNMAVSNLYEHYNSYPQFYKLPHGMSKKDFQNYVCLDQVNSNDNYYDMFFSDATKPEGNYPDNTWWISYDRKRKKVTDSQYFR